METLEYVAARTGVPQAQVYGVATFYALFNLEPQGTHTVSICRGTACHTRGSRALLERLKLQLGLREPREDAGGADKLTLTTPDRTLHDPHRGLLRPVRARAGGRGGPRDPRPREGAGAACARWTSCARRAGDDAHPGHRRLQRGPRGRARQAAAQQAADRRRHGHLRLGQRGRGRLPRVRVRDRRTRPRRAARAGRLLRLLRRGAARQRVGAGPPAADAAPRAAEPRGRDPRAASATASCRRPRSCSARSRSGTTSPAT